MSHYFPQWQLPQLPHMRASPFCELSDKGDAEYFASGEILAFVLA